MQLDEALQLALSTPEPDPRPSGLFLSGSQSLPRYALGKNQETLAVHRIAPLDGIIDDYAAQGEDWHGIPLLSTGQAAKHACVVNCSTSIRPVDALDHLRRSGFHTVIGIADLVHASGGTLPWPRFVQEQRREMESHVDSWQALYEALADETSRETLLDVLRFRLTADPAYMRAYRVRLAEQYFEDFMDFHHEVFVDAGGYDGDTSQAFAARYPDYRKILLFEPSERNLAAARTRLAPLRDVEFFNVGLSDSPGRLRFDSDSGSASAVAEAGAVEISVDTLDTVVAEPVSFIKMDLEGWELPALRGAQAHLRHDRPKLALATYHRATDLREISQFVGSFGHQYQIHLRHYTQGWSETVLFFR